MTSLKRPLSLKNTDQNLNNKKSKKLLPVQSNTLLNYFKPSIEVGTKGSNCSNSSKEFLIQQDIQLDSRDKLNQIESESKAEVKCDVLLSKNENIQIEENENVKTRYKIFDFKSKIQIITPNSESKENLDQKLKYDLDNELVEENFESVDEGTSITNKSNRKCPFYKRIEGTKIAVDAFNYGTIENCDAYFLSHFHYDHYIGLNKSFKQKLYCSQVTANLVIKKIRVDPKYIYPLEMNKFIKLYDNNDRIQVALVDANHCPGSVMFLFRLNFNGKLKYILHTGDFRASDELINDPMLKSLVIDTVHLDTTYCDSYYKFIPQSRAVSIGAELCYKELMKYPKTLIVCGSYLVGKEKVFIAIAEKLNAKIFVTRDKWNTLLCYNDEKLNQMLTLNPNETNLHVLSMGHLNIKDLDEHLAKYPMYSNLIAIKPTGWTHTENKTLTSAESSGLVVVKKSKNIIIYGLEYSEHSSFEELKKFIQFHRPKKIIPTVSVARKENRDKMQAYFNQWLSV